MITIYAWNDIDKYDLRVIRTSLSMFQSEDFLGIFLGLVREYQNVEVAE
jgi:hypothetical protein